MTLQTPYYLIDKSQLRKNLERIKLLCDLSGAKALLALKCFAGWSVFDFMAPYMAGTTSSSLYEVRLGREKFPGETHAYSVAWADYEIDEALQYADKIIFNSLRQFERFADKAQHIPVGLRLNPGFSSSSFDLADPSRPFSRLGESDIEAVKTQLHRIDGFMIHNQCENDNFEQYDQMLTRLEEQYGELFEKVNWVSLGGGVSFTFDGYPLEKLAERLKDFAKRWQVQVYLEPGEASVHNAASLETTVIDVFNNGKDLAIVDASIEAHMLDLLVYREPATVLPNEGAHEYMLCGKSCLAGDIFGEFKFAEPLTVGSRVSFKNAAAYTMVKKNWFNGLNMPAIAIREEDGTERLVHSYTYQDFVNNLS